MGDAVVVACFFTFHIFGNFTFATSLGTVASAVAAVTVAETPRELGGGSNSGGEGSSDAIIVQNSAICGGGQISTASNII